MNDEVETNGLVTRGMLRMTRNALGMSVDNLSLVLDVLPETVRRRWEHGDGGIPPNVHSELMTLVRMTELVVENMVTRSAETPAPAVIVYPRIQDVPSGHPAGFFGIGWWDAVAWSMYRSIPHLYVGMPTEVARHVGADVDVVHDHDDVVMPDDLNGQFG